MFDQVDYYRVCKISGNIKAALLCTEIKSAVKRDMVILNWP